MIISDNVRLYNTPLLENKMNLEVVRNPYLNFTFDLTFEELDKLTEVWKDYKWALSLTNTASKMGSQSPDPIATTIEDLIKWSKQPEPEPESR